MRSGILKGIRYFLWGLVALAFLAALAAAAGWLRPAPDVPYTTAGLSGDLSSIGGPFTMTDAKGAVFTEKNLAGKPTVMFFGFTTCPDVCPTTLADMGGWLESLGKDADKINAVFVSVDPARDTPEQIARYLAMFDARITGLTGTPAQLAEMAKHYRIYYKKVPMEGGGYTMDHTATIYLLTPDNRLAGTIAYREDNGIALQKIKRLVASP